MYLTILRDLVAKKLGVKKKIVDKNSEINSEKEKTYWSKVGTKVSTERTLSESNTF